MPRHLVRDIVLVAALAASAIVFWPRLESYIPPGWLPNRDESSSDATVQTRAPAPVAAPAPPQHMATILRSANVRSDPSKTATVISTLQRGTQVATVDTLSNWTLIRIDAKDGKPQQGWVYSSFLKNLPDSNAASSAAKHKGAK